MATGMFTDKVKITIKAGDGGDGMNSFKAFKGKPACVQSLTAFLPRRCLMKTIWNRRSSDAVLRRGFCFCTGRGSGHSAAPATYFSAASEETIFSAVVHIRS